MRLYGSPDIFLSCFVDKRVNISKSEDTYVPFKIVKVFHILLSQALDQGAADRALFLRQFAVKELFPFGQGKNTRIVGILASVCQLHNYIWIHASGYLDSVACMILR